MKAVQQGTVSVGHGGTPMTQSSFDRSARGQERTAIVVDLSGILGVR